MTAKRRQKHCCTLLIGQSGPALERPAPGVKLTPSRPAVGASISIDCLADMKQLAREQAGDSFSATTITTNEVSSPFLTSFRLQIKSNQRIKSKLSELVASKANALGQFKRNFQSPSPRAPAPLARQRPRLRTCFSDGLRAFSFYRAPIWLGVEEKLPHARLSANARNELAPGEPAIRFVVSRVPIPTK